MMGNKGQGGMGMTTVMGTGMGTGMGTTTTTTTMGMQ